MQALLHRLARPQRVFTWAVAGIVLCLIFAIVAVTVYQSEHNNRDSLKQQFRVRADIGELFLQAYVQELLDRERNLAELELSDARVSDASFNQVVLAHRFKAAVVLDGEGRLLQVYPYMPDLHGTHIASRYAHLRAALKQGSGVSGVVGSAAAGAPVVAFATRYETPFGTRIFSGGFDLRSTPLNSYMQNLLEMTGAHADLVDAGGLLVASSRQLPAHANVLDDIDPLLSEALKTGAADEYDGKVYFARDVTGTPWSLVISIDQRILYAALGQRRWIQWALFAGFCMATVVAAFLLMRLRSVTAMHAHLARVDRLTELPNRLHLEEHMTRLVSAAIRHKRPLSIFIVDVDHFKSVNDSYGHEVGDEVLRALSRRMAKAMRTEDMLGRWGGEEFMALLPNTPPEGATVVANRVRTMASAAPIITSNGTALHVTVSIGCATKGDARDSDYVQRADEALYSAKRGGRDRVVSSAPPEPMQDGELSVHA
jgi:diguanylate cyclase (GGDEF)-like protein